jgi:hypothetical protein
MWTSGAVTEEPSGDVMAAERRTRLTPQRHFPIRLYHMPWPRKAVGAPPSIGRRHWLHSGREVPSPQPSPKDRGEGIKMGFRWQRQAIRAPRLLNALETRVGGGFVRTCNLILSRGDSLGRLGAGDSDVGWLPTLRLGASARNLLPKSEQRSESRHSRRPLAWEFWHSRRSAQPSTGKNS